MRKLSAHYIFTGTGSVLKKGIIVVDDNGIITDMIDTKGGLTEISSVEFYNGIIVPGFVNCHCHLELSHLRGSFPQNTGLANFLKNVWEQRISEEESVIDAARKADREMWGNGISAVGDISNLSLTFAIKATSEIFYHTFIESLGFSPERADRAFEWSEKCLMEARALGLSASIVPHAPYSISKELFQKISLLAREENAILTIHNQESLDEDLFFITGSGPIYDHLVKNIKIDLSSFSPSGKPALSTIIDSIPGENQLLLVHNITTSTEDIRIISEKRPLDNTWFVLCPNSNLFIEGRLPDINLFYKNKLQVCLGTDSLSSNNKLSIFEEMKTIQENFPSIPLADLIIWATANGAKALGAESWTGTIEIGKKPGINLINGMDLQNIKLMSKSRLKRLI